MHHADDNQDLSNLRAINVKLGEAIRTRDSAYLHEFLDESLRVYRPDGGVADRREYLEAVFSRRYARIVSDVDHIHVFRDQKSTTAVVSVLVDVIMDVDGTESREGTFRNTRLFEKRSGNWVCVVWQNVWSRE